MAVRRSLHWVFKVGNRTKTMDFYQKVLGMVPLRHEEFDEGCKAACNGPYQNQWSKTMIGYGPEDSHFVIELTYNYGIKDYKVGNDLQHITVLSADAIQAAKSGNYPHSEITNGISIKDPNGHTFHLNKPADPHYPKVIQKVSIASDQFDKSVQFWKEIVGMEISEQNDASATLHFNNEEFYLEIKRIGEEVNHAEAFGRLAIACPTEELESIQSMVEKSGNSILTPLIKLDTPGKAAVQVVIVADPCGYEICFVGDKEFRQLSQIDYQAKKLLEEAISADKSDEFFEERNKKKKLKLETKKAAQTHDI